MLPERTAFRWFIICATLVGSIWGFRRKRKHSDLSTAPMIDTSINDLEAAKLLQNAWEFRQSHCWRSLQTFLVAAVAVSVAPYAMNLELVLSLDTLLWCFPLLGFLTALASIYLYGAEYVRCQAIYEKLKEILKRHNCYYQANFPWLFRRAIGWATVSVLLAASTALSALNTYAVWKTYLTREARQRIISKIEADRIRQQVPQHNPQ